MLFRSPKGADKPSERHVRPHRAHLLICREPSPGHWPAPPGACRGQAPAILFPPNAHATRPVSVPMAMMGALSTHKSPLASRKPFAGRWQGRVLPCLTGGDPGRKGIGSPCEHVHLAAYQMLRRDSFDHESMLHDPNNVPAGTPRANGPYM